MALGAATSLTLQCGILIPPRNASCRDFLLGILIFKELSARRLYKSFGVKGLIHPWY
jgi:hypothetical protein